MKQSNSNVLLSNRSAFTSRNSIDALINYARYIYLYKDNKIKKYIPVIKNGVMEEHLLYMRYFQYQLHMHSMYLY